MSMKTVREITTEECPWLDDNIAEGRGLLCLFDK